MASPLYVVTEEPGLESGPLPCWTDRGDAAIRFDPGPPPVARIELPRVPGAFQLKDVLTADECDQLVRRSEECGFHPDAPVSLPHHVRHNENLNWVVSERIDGTLWRRCRPLVPETVAGQTAQGLNARFRFYRYGPGDFFRPHRDGAWPGSRVVDGRLVPDARAPLRSQYSCLLFLSDGYEGGGTRFYVNGRDEAGAVSVHTPKGWALCFPHGTHPLHCTHAGETVRSGIKYIIRTDVLFG